MSMILADKLHFTLTFIPCNTSIELDYATYEITGAQAEVKYLFDTFYQSCTAKFLLGYLWKS